MISWPRIVRNVELEYVSSDLTLEGLPVHRPYEYTIHLIHNQMSLKYPGDKIYIDNFLWNDKVRWYVIVLGNNRAFKSAADPEQLLKRVSAQ